jgi:hypothetical protein
MSDDFVDVTIPGDPEKILDLQTGDIRDGGPVQPPPNAETGHYLATQNNREKRMAKRNE